MLSRLILLGIVVTYFTAIVQGNKLEVDTTAVAKKLEAKATVVAYEKDGLTPEKLEALTTAVLKEMKSTMKELKKLDPKNTKVPDKITNKLAVAMEKVMKKANLSKVETDNNINSMKAITKKIIEDYQNAN